MYWCVASAPDGNGEEIATWWKSLMEHICEIKAMKDVTIFHLEKWSEVKMVYTRQGIHAYTYIDICMELYCVLAIIYTCYMYKIDTKACEKLYNVIYNARLLEDIKKLSPHQQISSLESYYSVINHFAPKLLAFSYVGIKCRYLRT